MSPLDLFVIAVGLSMDAFAAAICKGLSTAAPSAGRCLLTGLYFGSFQAFMPLTGYLLGAGLPASFTHLDHWLAFGLLTAIGLKSVFDSRTPLDVPDASFGVRSMLPLALATSIDALTVGVSFAFLQVDILTAASLIGSVAFVLSAVGVRLGAVIGSRRRPAAVLTGGIILILTGLRILSDHL